MDTITDYTCVRCGYNTPQKGNLLIHLKIKTPCAVKFQDVSRESIIESFKKPAPIHERITCPKCKKEISKHNVARHRESCKIKTNIKASSSTTDNPSDIIAELRNMNRTLIERIEQLEEKIDASTRGASTSAVTTQDNINRTVVKRKRCKIPPSRRNAAWNAHIGINVGRAICMCCQKRQITQHKFTCGHIISDCNGGTIEVSNLRPICNTCNVDMFEENMRDFAKRIYNVTFD